jgi:hypothetical protein
VIPTSFGRLGFRMGMSYITSRPASEQGAPLKHWRSENCCDAPMQKVPRP